LYHTPDTFPIHPPSQYVNEVPLQTIHNPIPHTRYHAELSLAQTMTYNHLIQTNISCYNQHSVMLN
jgi:hypothetical protein